MTPYEEMFHRAELAHRVNHFAAWLDEGDWDNLIGLFASQVVFDYSSYSGTPPTETTPEAWFGRLRNARPGFDITQHSLSNLRCAIDGAGARVDAYVRAEHFLAAAGQDCQATLGGTYMFDFVRTGDEWKIRAMRLEVKWKTGNDALYALSFAGSVQQEPAR